MNLIYSTGSNYYVVMMHWGDVNQGVVFTNFMAVDDEGKTWFVPSAKVLCSSFANFYPTPSPNGNLRILQLQAFGAVLREIQ